MHLTLLYRYITLRKRHFVFTLTLGIFKIWKYSRPTKSNVLSVVEKECSQLFILKIEADSPLPPAPIRKVQRHWHRSWIHDKQGKYEMHIFSPSMNSNTNYLNIRSWIDDKQRKITNSNSFAIYGLQQLLSENSHLQL